MGRISGARPVRPCQNDLHVWLRTHCSGPPRDAARGRSHAPRVLTRRGYLSFPHLPELSLPAQASLTYPSCSYLPKLFLPAQASYPRPAPAHPCPGGPPGWLGALPPRPSGPYPPCPPVGRHHMDIPTTHAATADSAPGSAPIGGALARDHEFAPIFDHRALEAEVRALWERHQVFRFDRTGSGPVFSVDTPPPYVSASHLHVGHAMSYSQADFVVRYRRMRGERV